MGAICAAQAESGVYTPLMRFRLWLAVVAATILAGLVVPYGVLSGTPAPLDVFWFWCLFGAAVVALVVVGTARWRG